MYRETDMKKKLCGKIAMMLCVFILASCASGSLLGSQAEALREECPNFDEMEYVRPTAVALESAVTAVDNALAGDGTMDDIVPLLDECYNAYFTATTMSAIAEVRYLHDMTDEYYADEYAWCSSIAAELQQLFEQLYTLCANSSLASQLEEEYFWEGFTEEYGGDSTGVYTDAVVHLLQRESELISQYYDLSAAPTVVLDGAEVDLQEYLAASEGSDYTRAYQEYYRQYNSRFADIYIELIRTRRQLAVEMGYSSYEELAYLNYMRAYTPDDAAEYMAAVKQHIAPVYKEIMADNPYYYIDYKSMSEQRLVDTVGEAVSLLGGEAEEAFAFMLEHKLCDLSANESKADISFTTYLDNYDAPYLFIAPYGDTEDIVTLAHEFGHFLDSYINYSGASALDLAECYSQAMEFFVMMSLENVMDADEYATLRRIKMLSTLDTFISQSCYAEFESRVFAMDDAELTADNINMLFLELSEEYGLYDGTNADYYAMSWTDITHFFSSPFYVISYAISNDAAMQLYELECEASGKGWDKYMQMLPREYDTLSETLEAAGLSSPFIAGRAEVLAEIFENELLGAALTHAA